MSGNDSFNNPTSSVPDESSVVTNMINNMIEEINQQKGSLDESSDSMQELTNGIKDTSLINATIPNNNDILEPDDVPDEKKDNDDSIQITEVLSEDSSTESRKRKDDGMEIEAALKHFKGLSNEDQLSFLRQVPRNIIKDFIEAKELKPKKSSVRRKNDPPSTEAECLTIIKECYDKIESFKFDTNPLSSLKPYSSQKDIVKLAKIIGDRNYAKLSKSVILIDILVKLNVGACVADAMQHYNDHKSEKTTMDDFLEQHLSPLGYKVTTLRTLANFYKLCLEMPCVILLFCGLHYTIYSIEDISRLAKKLIELGKNPNNIVSVQQYNLATPHAIRKYLPKKIFTKFFEEL